MKKQNPQCQFRVLSFQFRVPSSARLIPLVLLLGALPLECAAGWRDVLHKLVSGPASNAPPAATVTPASHPVAPPVAVRTNVVAAPKASPATIRTLLARLRTNNVDVLVAAVEELGTADDGSPETLAAFNRLLLEQSDARVLQAVVDAAGDWDDVQPLFPGLDRCLAHPDEDLRSGVFDLISNTESKAAIDLLIKHLRNPYSDIRESCQESLEFITDQEFTSYQQWKAWWKTQRATFTF